MRDNICINFNKHSRTVSQIIAQWTSNQTEDRYVCRRSVREIKVLNITNSSSGYVLCFKKVEIRSAIWEPKRISEDEPVNISLEENQVTKYQVKNPFSDFTFGRHTTF